MPPDPELIAAVLAAVADDSRELIYRDEAMARVVKLAQQIATSDASVLITGESGTGKEVLARYVHTRSQRHNKPFISINCAAIPEHLLESELFGHEKGAFTGAIARRIGKFEEANGGTLLLDEISEMDARLQAKLLRAIQERVIDRVGGTRPVPVDIRILATSNRDLTQAVRDGSFREDLLFRLNVVNLKIPPLRERPADIIELAQYFIKKYADANGMAQRALSAEARRALVANRWQGNVRELENTLHRAVLLAGGDEIGARRTVDAGRRAHRSVANAGGGACRARRRAGHAQPGRPHGGGSRARPDPGDAAALPRQPHPCGEYPRHLDPHAAQQAQRICRRRHAGAAARRWRRDARRGLASTWTGQPMPTLYKILPAALWRAAEREGRFRGSPVDLQDGFIHFSTADQVVETAAKHFAGQRDLLLLRVDAASLGRPSQMGALARRRAIPASLWRAACCSGNADRASASCRGRNSPLSGARSLRAFEGSDDSPRGMWSHRLRIQPAGSTSWMPMLSAASLPPRLRG